MKNIIFFFISVLIFQYTSAQNTLKGKITDQNNEALIGASIFIFDLNKGTMTDADGNYEIESLPSGEINIRVSFIGFENKIQTISLKEKITEVNIVLKETDIETEEIVVSGGYNSTQHENAVKIDIFKINPESLAGSSNFCESFTKVPGVDMISKGAGVSKPVIRGLAMNDILVLNNGIRFENYQYSDHHPLGIDEFGIENVEIIKGPASLLYGSDAVGGVINFIKEKPAPVGTVIGDYNMQLFSNSLGMTNNIGIKGASKNFFAGIRVGNKTNADYLQGEGEFVPNTRFNELSLKANAGYSNRIGIFKIYLDRNQQKLGLAEDEPIEMITERGRKNDIYYQQFDNQMVSSENKLFIKNLKLEINSSLQKTELVHFAEPDVYEIQMDLKTLCSETKLYLPSSESSEYIIGLQGLNQINTNINNRETKLLPDATIDNYSAFGMFQYSFFKKVKVQSGVRYDIKQISTDAIGLQDDTGYHAPTDKQYGSLSGSIGATYNVSENLLFRTNFASAYRTPNLAELTSNGQHETRYEIGNGDLVPEKAYESDLSTHYHNDNFTLDLAVFNNLIKDYIYISPTGDTSANGVSVYRYFQNDAVLKGLETGLHIHPKNIEWLHFETTYAMVNGKKQNGENLPMIPANKLNFEIRIEKEKLAFFENGFIKINSSTAFEQNKNAPEETFTPGYTLWDAGIGTNIGLHKQKISLGININNIFDKKYIDNLSTLKEVNYFNPGRNISFSLKIPFKIK